MSDNNIRFSYFQLGPDVTEVVKNGVEAEAAGFDQMWIADHLADAPPINRSGMGSDPLPGNAAVLDAWTMLAYVGSKTNRIKLAPGVTDIQRIHPAKTASIVSTLDHLTSGRAVLGIGAGEVMNTKPYGMKWESPGVRVNRLKEYLAVVKLLWSSSYEEPVSFNGEFYSMDEAHLGLTPLQNPHPPIYVGSFAGTKMLSLTGEMADGWFPGTPNTPDSYREKINLIREAAKRAGRKFDEIDVIAWLPIQVGTSPEVREKVKQEFKRQIVFQRHLLKILGAEEVIERLPKELEYQYFTPTLRERDALQKMIDQLLIPEEVLQKGLDTMMAIGSVDQCIESIEKFVKAGATHIYPLPYYEDKVTREAIVTKIMPHFK